MKYVLPKVARGAMCRGPTLLSSEYESVITAGVTMQALAEVEIFLSLYTVIQPC